MSLCTSVATLSHFSGSDVVSEPQISLGIRLTHLKMRLRERGEEGSEYWVGQKAGPTLRDSASSLRNLRSTFFYHPYSLYILS